MFLNFFYSGIDWFLVAFMNATHYPRYSSGQALDEKKRSKSATAGQDKIKTQQSFCPQGHHWPGLPTA